jgi:hypothetical protein
MTSTLIETAVEGEDMGTERVSTTRGLEEYLSRCFPTRFMLLRHDAPEGEGRRSLENVLFDEMGRWHGLTHAGAREKVKDTIVKYPEPQELLVPDAQEF